MKVKFQNSFTLQFTKLSKAQRELVKEAIELFADDPMHDSLRNHPLREQWADYRSITADNDLRLHYRIVDKDTALFVAVGSHEQLYR
jgi:addiction module RelE/StbE family toxin